MRVPTIKDIAREAGVPTAPFPTSSTAGQRECGKNPIGLAGRREAGLSGQRQSPEPAARAEAVPSQSFCPALNLNIARLCMR